MRYNMLFYIFTLFFIFGCAEEQDSGIGSRTTVSGVALDGPVARALVYIDVNGNKQLDVFEPRAFTDNDGRFGIGANGTNYCELDSTDTRRNYCLTLPPASDSTLQLLIVDGYDTLSASPFYGTMSRELSRGNISDIVATPLTSLYGYLSDTSKAIFLGAESHSNTEIEYGHYLNFETELSNRLTLAKNAILIQKVVDVIGHAIERAYTNFNSSGTATIETVETTVYSPPNPAPIIYAAMAEILSVAYAVDTENPPRLIDIFQNANTVESMILLAESALNSHAVIEQIDGQTLPENLAGTITQLAGLTSRQFEDEFTTMTQFRALSGSIDVAVIAMRKANYNPDSEAANLVSNLFPSSAAYLAKLEDDNVDLHDLSDRITSGDIEAPDDIDYTNRTPISDVDNKVLTISNTEQSESADNVQLNFGSATPSDTSADEGTLTAVLALSEETRQNLDIESGEAVSGTWSRLDDYSLLLNIDIAGSPKPVIMKRNASGDGYVFDFDGNLTDFTPAENCDLQETSEENQCGL